MGAGALLVMTLSFGDSREKQSSFTTFRIGEGVLALNIGARMDLAFQLPQFE
jgi:hypothetical protein